jgi:diguanylate cyclase (GGDEF)-like protein/PAS domain S-box-containing protein
VRFPEFPKRKNTRRPRSGPVLEERFRKEKTLALEKMKRTAEQPQNVRRPPSAPTLEAHFREEKMLALRKMKRAIEEPRARQSSPTSENRYRAILDSIEEPYYEADLSGNFTFVSRAFCRLLGYSEHELNGRNVRELQKSEAAASMFRAFSDVYRTGIPTKGFDWEMVCKGGAEMLVEGSAHPIKNVHGRAIGFHGILRDVTARRSAERALRENEERFRSLTHLSSDWYWEQDSEFRFIRFEGPRKADFGSYLGKTTREIGMEVESGESHFARLRGARPYRDVVMYYVLFGEKRYLSMSGEPIFDHGHFIGYRGVARDITGRKRADERVQYLATHDELTGLPNRTMFSQILSRAIKKGQAEKGTFAVLFVDLDRFKIINDSLGHAPGDVLLSAIGSRLNQSLRVGDAVGRLGGDEFVLLLQDVDGREQVSMIAREILSSIIKPVILLGQECRVTASIGIAMYPDDGQDEQSLTKNADVAMYRAKEEGKNNFRFYSRDIMGQSIERLMLESSLRNALERNEFFLHYQPKKSLSTGDITGVEALLRWKHPELGVVAPQSFIPLAEDTGLIVPIGQWLMKTVCSQNMAWQHQGLPALNIAVNLSASQFSDDGLLQCIDEALAESGLPAERLEIEITESMVMKNAEGAVKLLNDIRQRGVRLAIDDFGTGYSSMALIKRFPIHTLKIDRSFVREIPKNPEDNAIAEAIIGMAKALGLSVVAEGVETTEQEDFLRARACDEMQGFLFSKPLAPEAFAVMMREHVLGQLRTVAARNSQGQGTASAA